MIIVKKGYQDLSVMGHAEQEEYGKDIVCASVSTAIIMTVNLLELFSKLDKVTYSLADGNFHICYQADKEVEKIIQNLEFTLDDLKTKYPNYIK